MKFGLFYEAQCPKPWDESTERRLFQEGLAQLELADQLGFDYIWLTEHHGLEEHAHSAAPEVLLGALTQRTKQIRLGTGVCHAIHKFNHPIRTAERIATLDLLSNGRVDFGSGESNTLVELSSFEIPHAEKRAMWEESLEVVLRLMVETPFAGHSGKYIQIPPINVVPKPLQKPHPPLWMAGTRREAALAAARKGVGVLGYGFVDQDECAFRVRKYYETFERECKPVGFAVNPNIATLMPMTCLRDEKAALERGLENYLFFCYTTCHYYLHGIHRPGTTNIWEEFQANRQQLGLTVEDKKQSVLREAFEKITGPLRGAIGTPDQVRQVLLGYEAAGVDMVIFQAQAGNARHEDVCESFELFAREVMPEFKERDGKARAAKHARLAPTIERLNSQVAPNYHPQVDAAIEPPPTYQYMLMTSNLG